MADESELELECRKFAESQGYYLLKWVSPGVRGVPDRILLGPKRFIVFIEFKAPGEKPSVLQEIWLGRIRKFFFKAEVIWNFEDFLRLLPSK
jgi:hypothetical protein